MAKKKHKSYTSRKTNPYKNSPSKKDLKLLEIRKKPTTFWGKVKYWGIKHLEDSKKHEEELEKRRKHDWIEFIVGDFTESEIKESEAFRGLLNEFSNQARQPKYDDIHKKDNTNNKDK